jgi:hypothetical protein
MNQFRDLRSYFVKMSSVIHTFMSRSWKCSLFPSSFRKHFVYAFSFIHSCYIPRPFNPPHCPHHVTRPSNHKTFLARCLLPPDASSLASPNVLPSTIFWSGPVVRPERFEICVISFLKNVSYLLIRGTRWRSWLRHCATSRQVAGSIPDVAIDIILQATIWLWDRLSL